MSFVQEEFEAIMADETKLIDSDIAWFEDEDHSPSQEFRVEVKSGSGYPLFIKGSYNPLIPALTYSLIHRGVGRIYGLCYGKGHHNPTCQRIGNLHKHSWNDAVKDKNSYVPTDIRAPAHDPVHVWREFCAEARIRHDGRLDAPPLLQKELF